MKHLIVVRRIGRDHDFTPVLPKIEGPEVERLAGRAKRAHAKSIVTQFDAALEGGRTRRERHRPVLDDDSEQGALLRFDARTPAGIDLEFFKQKHGFELLSSRGKGAKQRVRAFASDASIEKLATAAETYGLTDDRTATRRARYSDFFDRIGNVRLASVATLWNSEALAAVRDVKSPHGAHHRP